MGKGNRVWKITGAASLAATLMLICGFVYAVSDVIFPAPPNTSSAGIENAASKDRQAAPGNMDVTAVGDSLAKGTGDDTGSGFARATSELLQVQGINSKLVNNLGINGLTTSGLLPMLDEDGVQYALRQAGVIILSIGANDLFAGADQMTELPDEEQLSVKLKQAEERFAKIVEAIREINSEAQLVYVMLYNPFSDLEEVREQGNRIVQEWNRFAATVMGSTGQGLAIPTSDLFTFNSGRYLAEDHFHPNRDGYQAIAERIVKALAVTTVSGEERK
ncbi:lipase/acylhydrolase [Paenibacillus antibioticophila]|uniref:Lipase/acylhydrolase n=1 Tax=Paenibacillus antibioticophila TaxID=1274374 RepID=A0A920CGF1_9BACL|nr:GDSL-type esterase/lipase family protein [Paenibacillus antibioticophila]GIO36733.1 lipase/acylhydrolase [Paenibacillus antibioticophila]